MNNVRHHHPPYWGLLACRWTILYHHRRKRLYSKQMSLLMFASRYSWRKWGSVEIKFVDHGDKLCQIRHSPAVGIL